MKITIPKQLENLQAAKELIQKRQESRTPTPKPLLQSARTEHQIQPIADQPDLPKPPKLIQETFNSGDKISSAAFDVGIAIKLIPVELAPYKEGENFVAVVNMVDQVLDTITDQRTDINSGSGFTQYWTDISQKDKLKWVPCDILKKIDDDKFLVFISENNFNKVVSTSNIIFQDVVLLVDDENNVDDYGQYKTQTSLINIQQFISQYCQQEATQQYLIKIFQQQLQNTKLKQKFEQAIQSFGNLAIDITRQQFEQTDNFTEYAVTTLQQNRLNDMKIPQNHPSNERALLVKKQAQNRQKQAYHVPLTITSLLTQNLSGAVLLCNHAISRIEFAKINMNSPIFDFKEVSDEVCAEFVQHAQLTDAQMQILQQAFADEGHQLHWCAEFLALFLWSSHKIFQTRKISQYCFGLDEPNAGNMSIFEAHRKQFRKNQLVIEKHINNLYSKQFVTLQHYIATIFEQHKNDIMARASHFIDILWTNELPKISVRVSESFIQHFSYKGIDQFFLKAKVKNNDYSQLSFNDTFSEKLINTHKVIYQILSPHIVDQILSDFANSVLTCLNDKLHHYQSSHGRTPTLQLRDKFAEESYQQTHSKFVQVFKIMEIQFFRIFIDELYENALPEWFYFLLALIHGGNKKKSTTQQTSQQQLQSKSELTKILHLTPNEQSFISSIQKDIDSLNKYSDFKIPIDKEIAKKILGCLSKWEFKALPEITDNFVSGIKISPDPLTISKNLESCISQLSMFYSSSPKFSDILIYNYKSGIVENQLTLQERELFLDKTNLSYKSYLEVAYNNIPLQGGSQGNPFNLGFIKSDGKAANNKSKQKFMTIVGSKVQINESPEEEFDFDIKIETKLAEAIYYEPSILLQKLVKLSKVSAEKLTKYFEIFVRYFTLHIQKSQINIQFLNKKVDLMPEQIQKHSDYEYLVESISQNQKMVKIIGTQEEQIKLKLKPFSDFLKNKALVDIVIEDFQSGLAPPETCNQLINVQIGKLIEILKIVYDNTFMILSLPNICYYSSFKISLTQLLQALQVQDKILFDLYSQRLQDYFILILQICNECLDKVNSKLNQTSFTSTQEIGEIYEICKLFTYNKGNWLNIYQQMNNILEQYEEIPIGHISNLYYNNMHTQLIASQRKFKQVFTSQSLVTNRVSLAYQQCFSFLQNVQNWFDLLIQDIFTRAKEYFSICYSDWIGCIDDQQIFKQKYPLLTQSIVYPKPLKLDEFQLIDTKRLIKEIEQTSLLPIFKSNFIKIHTYERTSLFKEENLNDAFQEVEEIINYSIQTLVLLNNLKLQLLGNTEIQFFDTIDKILFATQQKKDAYILQLKNKGDIIQLNKETLDIILSNTISQTNSTQLSRLSSLYPVFQLASRLVFICNNIQNNFSQWLDQSLSMVNLEEIKRQLIEAIKVSTFVIINFSQRIRIVTVAQNLLQFLQDQHNVFYLIFLAKTAIYENNMSTIQVSKLEIVERLAIDQLLKIDSKDFSVNSTLINIIIQSLNLKISDDVRTADMLDVLKPFDDFIFLNFKHSISKIRADKLVAYQQGHINKIISEGNLNTILETQFILPSMMLNETPKLKRDLNDFLILGPDNQQIKQVYTVVYHKDYTNHQFFVQKMVNTVRSNIIGCDIENDLLQFLNTQKIQLVGSLFRNEITTFQTQQMINSSDSLNQMVTLHWQIYTYAGWVQMLNEISTETANDQVNILIKPLSVQELDIYNQGIKQLRGLLAGCYTTASNAVQLSQRKFVRDKLWETVFQIYDLFRNQTEIKNAFYRTRKFYPKDLQITYLLDLMWYDIHSTPQLEKAKYSGKAAIVTQLTDDINLTLCTLLTQLGFPDSMFNILYFLSKTDEGVSYGYYYIDGIIQSNATYFKFAYPLIYNSLRQIYITLTTNVLQKVVLITLETHMLYWQQKILGTYDFNIQQILVSYPSNISFHICAQVIMHIFKNILSFNYKKDNQIQFLQQALQQFKVLYEQECNPEEKIYEFDINIALRQAQLSMLTSFENYLFFDTQSTLQSYPVGQQFQRQQNLNQQKKQATQRADSNNPNQANGIFDMLQDMEAEDDTESDSDLGDDLFGDTEQLNQDNKQRDFLHDGFNAEDFIILAMLRASQGIGPEQTQTIIYFISLLDSFLSSFQANSVWLEFVLPYCNKPLDQLIFALRKQINETKLAIYDNKYSNQSLKYSPKIDIFVNGGFILQSHGFIKVASLYSPQILRITQMILQKYISKILEQMNIQSQIVCITPITDKYYYHLTYCLFIDIISNFLQRKVEHVHLISTTALEIIQNLTKTGIIILITGLELAPIQTVIKLQSMRNDAEKCGSNLIYIVPELVQTSLDQSLITFKCKNILQYCGFDINCDNIFRFQELYFQQCEYEILYKKLSLYQTLQVPQQIARFLFSSQLPIEQAVVQFCYIVAQQNKFLQSKINQIIKIMQDTMSEYLSNDFFEQDLIKKITTCDQFLFKFFDIQPEILFQNIENDIIIKDDFIGPKIPQQLSSFVYISSHLKQKTCLNSQGWKYISDIILLLFSARIDQIGLYFQQYNQVVIQQVLDCIYDLSTNQIGIPVQVINGSQDFSYSSDNILQILPGMFYVLVYKNGQTDDFFDYKSTIEEFLVTPKPFDAIVLVISDCQELLSVYCQYYQTVAENIISMRHLFNDTANTMKFQQILQDDIQVLEKKGLTQTEFDYIFTKFNINIDTRNTQQLSTKFIVLLFSELFDFCSQLFNITEAFIIRQITASASVLFQYYGFLNIKQSLQLTSYLLQNQYYEICDNFLTQISFSANGNTGVAFANLTVFMFSIIYASFQCYYVNSKYQEVPDAQITLFLNQTYQTAYQCIQLDRMCPQMYVNVINSAILNYNIEHSDYINSISQALPLPSQQNQQNSIDYSDIFKVYLPQYQGMVNTSYIELEILRGQLVLFSVGKISNQILSQPKLVQTVLPFNDILDYKQEVKTDIFLTGTDIKESRLQFFFRNFSESYQFDDPHLRMLIFQCYSSIKLGVVQILQSKLNSTDQETVFRACLMQLNVNFRSFQNMQAVNLNRHFSEYRYFSYYISNQSEVSHFIQQIREYLTLIGENAIMLFFTVVKFYVSYEMFESAWFQTLLSYQIQVPDQTGAIRHYKLLNCSFTVILQQYQKIQSFTKKHKYPLLNCGLTLDNKYPINSSQFYVRLEQLVFSQMSSNKQDIDQIVQQIFDQKNQQQNKISQIDTFYNQLVKIEKDNYMLFWNALSMGKLINIAGCESLDLKQLAHSFNVGLYHTYYNRLLFGCIKDAGRAEYKEMLQENYDKFKNDQNSLYDFNEDIIEEAQQFRFLLDLAASPVLELFIPTHLIKLQQQLSYQTIVQQLAILTNSMPDLPIEQEKIITKSLLIDVGDITGVYQSFSQQYINSTVQTLTTREKILTTIRVALNITLNLQRGAIIPLSSKNKIENDKCYASGLSGGLEHFKMQFTDEQIWFEQPISQIQSQYSIFGQKPVNYVPNMSNQIFQITQPPQIQNYDIFRPPAKKDNYEYVILVFPLSLLVATNMLSTVLNLINPGNQAQQILTVPELQDVYQEAIVFTKLENLSFATLQMIMAQKMQIYIIQDIEFDLQVLPPFINFVSLDQYTVKTDKKSEPQFILEKHNNQEYIQMFNQRLLSMIDQNIVTQDERLCFMSQFLFSNLQQQVRFGYQILLQLALSIKQTILIKETQKLKTFAEFQVKINGILDICQQSEVYLLEYQKNQSAEKIVLDQLKQTQVTLTKINNDLQAEFKSVINSTQIKQQELSVVQNRIQTKRKNQIQIIQQTIIELEQTTKSEIIDLYNSNVTNQVMIFAFLTIWKIIKGKETDFVTNLKYPSDDQVFDLWKSIQQEMFVDIAIPHDLINFEYKTLPEGSISLINQVCSLKEFQNEMLAFTQTRLQRRIANFLIGIHVYYSNMVEPEQEIMQQQLQSSIQELETKRTYLKEEQLTIKAKIAENQRQIDSFNVKVDSLTDQVNVQNNSVQIALKIKTFFIQQKNDIIFDIQQLQTSINLLNFTSLGLASYILYGADTLKQMLSIICPVKSQQCLFCAIMNSQPCQSCSSCNCLCVCLKDVDDDGNIIKSKKKAPTYSTQEFISSREKIYQLMNQINQNILLKKQVHDRLLGMGQPQLQELQQVLILKQAFPYKINVISQIFNKQIISIVEQISFINNQYVINFNNNYKHVISMVQTLVCGKEAAPYIIFNIYEASIDLIDILGSLVQYNYAVQTNSNLIITIGKEKIKVNSQFSKVNLYVVFYCDIETQFAQYCNQNLFSYSQVFIQNQSLMFANKLFTVDSQMENYQLSMSVFKEQFQFQIHKYIKQDEVNRYLQDVYDAKVQENSYFSCLTNIISGCKNIGFEPTTPQFQNLYTQINSLENSIKLKNTLTSQYKQFQAEFTVLVAQKDSWINQYYKAFFSIQNMIVKLSPNYPNLIKALNMEKMFTTSLDNVNINQQIIYQQLLKNLITLLLNTISLGDIELLAYLLIVHIEKIFQRFSIVGFNFLHTIIKLKLSAQKIDYSNLLRSFSHDQTDQILAWMTNYDSDFKFAMKQQNIIEYISTSQKIQIPQFLRDQTPVSGFYLLSLQLSYAQTSFQDSIRQYLLQIFNYQYLFSDYKNMNGKQQVEYILKSISKAPIIFQTENFSLALQELMFLGKTNNINFDYLYSIRDYTIQFSKPTIIRIYSLQFQQFEFQQALRYNSFQNVIFLIEIHPEWVNSVVLDILVNSSYSLGNFDSIHNYDQFKLDKTFYFFSNFITSNIQIQQPNLVNQFFTTTQNNIYELYQIFYLTGYILASEISFLNHHYIPIYELIQSLLSRFQFLITINSVEQDSINDAVSQLLQFLATQLPQSLNIINISNNFNPIAFIQQFSAIKLPLQAAMHFLHFLPLPDGIFISVAAYIRNNNKFLNGKIVESMKNFSPQKQLQSTTAEFQVLTMIERLSALDLFQQIEFVNQYKTECLQYKIFKGVNYCLDSEFTADDLFQGVGQFLVASYSMFEDGKRAICGGQIVYVKKVAEIDFKYKFGCYVSCFGIVIDCKADQQMNSIIICGK